MCEPKDSDFMLFFQIQIFYNSSIDVETSTDHQ